MLTGDFNATVDELEPLREVLTVVGRPARDVSRRRSRRRAIDHIAFSAHWRLSELAAPCAASASDHRPLVADLELV